VIIIKEAIREDFMQTVGKRLERCPMEIRYAYQEKEKLPEGFAVPEGREKPWGTSHAVLCAAPQIDGAPFAVINADDYYGRSAFKTIYEYLCSAEGAGNFCMVGYQLGNTVTEHGSVARGVCVVDQTGKLADITERTRIEKHPDGIRFTEDGESWTNLAADTVVSMNMWGFTPDFLDALQAQFPGFLTELVPTNPLKAEFLLPRSVDALLAAGVLVLSGVAVFLFVRSRLKPLHQLETAAASIAEGDFSVQVDEKKGDPELRELSGAFNTMTKKLQGVEAGRREFVANVSHELKTPLTSITGYAELIESGMAEGEMIKRFAGEIHKNASRLLTLINDTIRLAEMDESRNEIEREMVEAAMVAENVAEHLHMSVQKHQVTLSVDAKPCMISADRRMIEELMYNLCDNAIRYNVPGGSVRVQVIPLKEHVILRVQDTGIGISKEHQAHIFERFYRVDKSRSKATGGTGLGLAIVKHIAVKHNAEIAIESEPGRGTSIAVTFERYNRS
jgi:signal transduction histidine kinase